MIDQIKPFEYNGHSIAAECRSGGVASVEPPALARASNAMWHVTMDGNSVPGERAGTPDDTEDEIVLWAKECVDAYVERV